MKRKNTRGTRNVSFHDYGLLGTGKKVGWNTGGSEQYLVPGTSTSVSIRTIRLYDTQK